MYLLLCPSARCMHIVSIGDSIVLLLTRFHFDDHVNDLRCIPVEQRPERHVTITLPQSVDPSRLFECVLAHE